MDLASKVTSVLRKLGPSGKFVYKRVTTTLAGSSLLGIYPSNAAEVVDTLLDPQPIPEQLQERASVLSSSGLVLEATDYEIILSVNSITLQELEQPGLTIVLKSAADGSGTNEEYRILGYNPYQFQGKYVGYCIYVRRKTTN
jgi:hypothetical protein